ncbi:hypothetical protein OG21DRAFT_1476302 [Imleria badia]|nr:hypothetical protein OG21DRAFT_1476302 [Imleria badia]
MSSPAARAEARRKAILGRGGDRLAKLTTSARGEEGPAYLHGDAPARGSAAFVGEETSMPPPPPPPKDTPRPSPSPPASDPSVWSEEQQHQFMQALMGGALNPAQPQPQPPPPPPFATPPPADDPFATVMAQLARMNPPQGGATPGRVPAPPAPPKPPTRLQKWMPLLHLVCMWCLLAYFVLWKEPQVFVEKTAGAVEVAFWKRWPKLVTQALGGAWGVQVIPFFWAFMTMQVMLHSLRVFSGHNEVQPPALLSLALPHLPPPLPSLITNGLGYLRMGNAFLDDIAAIVFGIGMIIVITTWFAD